VEKAIGGGTKYHYVKKLVAELAEKKLVQLPDTPWKKDTRFELHAHFEQAVETYVNMFFSRFGDKVWGASTTPELPARDLAEVIFREQVGKFYPAWHQLLDSLGSKAHDVYKSKNVARKLKKHGLYWGLLFATWRNYLGSHRLKLGEPAELDSDWRDSDAVMSDCKDSMKHLRHKILQECLSTISEKSGGQILRRKNKKRGHPLYTFNHVYTDEFLIYTQNIPSLRSGLEQKLASFIVSRRSECFLAQTN
jgi:hypothetical protein